AFDPTSLSTVGLTQSPTLSLQATYAGLILGTAAYMSPEQASGKPVDKRADIWAFGVVLWEILTGKAPFEGETISHTLAYVITKEPEWSALPPNISAPIRRLLRRCLEKDRKRRLPDIASARLELDDALIVPSDDASRESVAIGTSRSEWSRTLPWALAAAAMVALTAVLTSLALWRKAVTPSLLHLSSEIGADASLVTTVAGTTLALSPNGDHLAFAAQKTADGPPQLYVRRLDQLNAVLLTGTDGAADPFFSPDGLWIAFFAGGKLKKIAVSGGAAVTLCDAPNGRGGTWADGGTIVFTRNSGP